MRHETDLPKISNEYVTMTVIVNREKGSPCRHPSRLRHKIDPPKLPHENVTIMMMVGRVRYIVS